MATLYYRPYTSDPITDGDLPDEAGSTPLPAGALADYDYIFPAGPGTSRRPAAAAAAAAPISNSLVPKLHNYGPDYIAQLDGQLGEIEKYRDALRKMGQDILALRDRVRELEMENSALRRDLGSYSDASKILQDSVELDGIPKAELMARYAALRQNLRGSVAQLQQYRDRVHRLQNELIAGNQAAGGMERLADAHESQQRLLQRLQERVAKQRSLEEACAKQEKVIERMERLLRDRRNTAGREDDQRAKALMEENRKLRDEIAAVKTAQQQKRSGMESSERLELYQLLDKAETRIASLEKQIDATARKQRREKSRLQEDIEEAERAAQRRRNRHGRRDGGVGGGHGGNQPNVQFFAVPVPFEVKGGNGRQRRRSDDDDYDDDYD